jgi:hypothetical protein
LQLEQQGTSKNVLIRQKLDPKKKKKAKGYQACRNLAQLLYLLSLKRVGHKKLTEEICQKFRA